MESDAEKLGGVESSCRNDCSNHDNISSGNAAQATAAIGGGNVPQGRRNPKEEATQKFPACNNTEAVLGSCGLSHTMQFATSSLKDNAKASRPLGTLHHRRNLPANNGDSSNESRTKNESKNVKSKNGMMGNDGAFERIVTKSVPLIEQHQQRPRVAVARREPTGEAPVDRGAPRSSIPLHQEYRVTFPATNIDAGPFRAGSSSPHLLNERNSFSFAPSFVPTVTAWPMSGIHPWINRTTPADPWEYYLVEQQLQQQGAPRRANCNKSADTETMREREGPCQGKPREDDNPSADKTFATLEHCEDEVKANAKFPSHSQRRGGSFPESHLHQGNFTEVSINGDRVETSKPQRGQSENNTASSVVRLLSPHEKKEETGPSPRSSMQAQSNEPRNPRQLDGPVSPLNSLEGTPNGPVARSFLPRGAKAKTCDDNAESDALVPDFSRYAFNGSGLEIAILSRLDDSTYDGAISHDAIHLFREFVLPNAFPWHDPKIELEMTMPFDIEDLPAVVHATGFNDKAPTEEVDVDRGHALQYQDTLFSLGFGRYETGRCRRPRDRHGKLKVIPTLCAGNVTCAARRGELPGEIELAVKLVHPSIDRALYKASGSRFSQGSDDGPSQASSRRSGGTRHDELKLAEYFESVSTLPWTAPWEIPNLCLDDGKGRQRKHFRSIDEFMESGINVKRHKISVRVGGVSSRSSLFPELLLSANSTSRKQILTAAFPPSIQTGRPAQNGDASASASAAELGSYDVQFPQIHGNQKMKVNVGRGRLIWSEPCAGVQGGIMYKSVLNNQVMESSTSHRRPRQATVGVRVDGVLFCENDEEPPPSTVNNEEDGINSFDWSNAMCSLDHKGCIVSLVRNPKKGTDPDFVRWESTDAAVLKHTPPTLLSLPCIEGFVRVVCLKPGAMQGSNIHELLVNAAKSLGKRQGNASESCVCSVCWAGNTSDESDGNSNVFECMDCGLPAHLECCLDTGEFIDALRQELWRCSVCADYQAKKARGESDKYDGTTAEETKLDFESETHAGENVDGAETNDPGHSPTKKNKPRRHSKLPSKYDDDYACPRYISSRRRSSPRKGNDAVVSSAAVGGKTLTSPENTGTTAYVRPSHKCSLCPHAGGAMSKMKRAAVGDDDKWTHEICRAWTQFSASVAVRRYRSFPPVCQVDTVCALCGKCVAEDVVGENQESCSLEASLSNKEVELVKCGAQGCHVSFHPMCAAMVSRLASVPEPRTEQHRTGKGKKRTQFELKQRLTESNALDSRLAAQYTFHLMSVPNETTNSNKEGQSAKNTVPVVFCGWHNPYRVPSLYGCPPVSQSSISNNNMLHWVNIPPYHLEVNTPDKEGGVSKKARRL